jgi:hypothetical protein
MARLRAGEPPTTKDHPNMRRVVGIAKILLWACAGLMAILVILSWVAPGLRDERSFLLLGGAAVGPAMVCSAFLLWWELRDNRRELRAARRESRDVSFEEGAEWTSKVWFYVLALFLSFSLSWYVLPALILSLF